MPLLGRLKYRNKLFLTNRQLQIDAALVIAEIWRGDCVSCRVRVRMFHANGQAPAKVQLAYLLEGRGIASLMIIKTYLILSHLISSHLISPHLISSHLISSHLISSHLISSHLISSHLISSHLISSHLILSYLILSYLRR